MSETAFQAAARADLARAGGQSVHVPELDMSIFFDVPTAGSIRRIMRDCAKGDDLKASALVVRDHAKDAEGRPIVTRDDAGLQFLMDHVRPAVLGRLAKAIAGESAEELGNG